jgi:hypothetical protein
MRFSAVLAASIVVLALGMAATATALANEASAIPCGPKVQRLCEAAAIQDKQERNRELLALLGQGLESLDPAIRDQTFHYLTQVDDVIDPRLLRSSLQRFDELDEDTKGRFMMERADFDAAPREEHLTVYHAAIANGEARIGTVTTITRATAIDAAAREGLGELRSLIVSVTQGWPTDTVERALVRLDLRDGAQNARDGDVRAVRRLDTLAPEELKGKLEGSKGWREVVADTAHAACSRDDDQACTIIERVIQRQRELLSAEQERFATSWDFKSGPVPEFPETIRVMSEWMHQLHWRNGPNRP